MAGLVNCCRVQGDEWLRLGRFVGSRQVCWKLFRAQFRTGSVKYMGSRNPSLVIWVDSTHALWRKRTIFSVKLPYFRHKDFWPSYDTDHSIIRYGTYETIRRGTISVFGHRDFWPCELFEVSILAIYIVAIVIHTHLPIKPSYIMSTHTRRVLSYNSINITKVIIFESGY